MTRRSLARRVRGCLTLLRRVASAAENAGVVAVEFAIYGTLILTIFAGTMDIGLLMFVEFQIDSAVSAGAQYAAINAASVNSASGANLATATSNVVANANGTGWEDGAIVVNNGPPVTVTGGSAASSGTASNADNCYCPTGSPSSWSWGSSVTCGSSYYYTGGGVAGNFVTITASRSFTPVFPTFGFVQNGTISRSALVEAQ
jgi:Flp pilus assembly protein TadG